MSFTCRHFQLKVTLYSGCMLHYLSMLNYNFSYMKLKEGRDINKWDYCEAKLMTFCAVIISSCACWVNFRWLTETQVKPPLRSFKKSD